MPDAHLCLPASDGHYLHTLAFDLYERYWVAAQVVGALRRSTSYSMLDVGGHSDVLWPGFSSLVSAFVPEAQSFVIDLHREPGLKNYAVGSGTSLPFKDATFDFVLAQDTLEHVVPEERKPFIRELLRVSRDIVFLSFPFFTPLNASCDGLVYRYVELRKNVELPALKEHLSLGLPEQAVVGDWLREAGFPFTLWTHGSTLIWLQMMVAQNHLWAQGVPEFEQELNSIFNSRFASGDYREPCYRSFVLIAKNRDERELTAAVESCRGGRLSDSDEQAVYSLCEMMIGSTCSVEVERRAQHSINLIGRLGEEHQQRIADLEIRLAEKKAEAQHFRNLLVEKQAEAQHFCNLLDQVQPQLADASTRLAEAVSQAAHYRNLLEAQQQHNADVETRLAANDSLGRFLLEQEKLSRTAAEEEVRALKDRLARFPLRLFVG
jgi:hypothetical protein